LFGSEDEENTGVASQPDRGLEREPKTDMAPRPDTTPIPDEKDLFGEDSDAGEELDEKALFGSDDEAGADIDEKDLFGSDDDEGAKPGQREGAAKPDDAQSEMSDMDEREIFGDVSDDEPEKVDDIILRQRPTPDNDREFISMRLPNILSVEKEAFNPESMSTSAIDGYREWKNTLNKRMSRLQNPENCVRWRFKKGPDGQNLNDEDGRPQYESNTRFVEWEDGSKTLYVGKEAFNIMEIDHSTFIFEENSQDVHVCHGSVKKKLLVTPQNLQSDSHFNIKKSQFRNFTPNRRTLLLSEEDAQANQALQQLTAEHKKRQIRDEQRQKRTLEAGQEVMTAAFLEDDQLGGGVGPSIMDIKQAGKREAKRQRSG